MTARTTWLVTAFVILGQGAAAVAGCTRSELILTTQPTRFAVSRWDGGFRVILDTWSGMCFVSQTGTYERSLVVVPPEVCAARPKGTP